MSSRLIVPAHAKGLTESERRVQQARNTHVLSFIMVIPGFSKPLQVNLNQPVPLEGIAAVVAQFAYQEIEKGDANNVADRVLEGETLSDKILSGLSGQKN